MKRLALLLALCWPAVGAAQVTGGSGGVTYIPFPPPGMTYSANNLATGGFSVGTPGSPVSITWSGNNGTADSPFLASTAYTGTCTGTATCNANFLKASWDVTSSTNVNTLNVTSTIGGAGQVGGLLNFNSVGQLTAPTGNVTSTFYQSGNFSMTSSANDGGGSGTEAGNIVGLLATASLKSGATHFNAVTAQENDVSIQTGGSGLYENGMTVVLLSNNAVAPDNQGMGFSVNAASGATPTFDVAYAVGSWQGVNPLKSTAAVLKFVPNGGTGAGPSVGCGIDLGGLCANSGSFTFATAAFDSTGFKVDGSGNLNANAINTTPIGATTASSGAFTTLSANGVTNINASNNAASNIGTGTTTSNVTLGGTANIVNMGGPTALTTAGAVSAASWTTSGLALSGSAQTLTDTTVASGTLAREVAAALPAYTIATTSTGVTITNLDELYLPTPVAGTNVTASNLWSLETTGAANFGGLVNAVNGASIVGTTNINASHNSVTNINTGTSSSAIHIGDGSGNNAIGIGNGTGVVTFASPNTFSNAAVKMTALATGTNADTVCYKADGTLLIQASTCTISSLRFKEHVLDFKRDALSLIDALGVKSFNMKPAPNPDPNYGTRQVGLIAEDVARVMPECAIYENDLKTPKSYRQECVIAMLVKGEQQLAAENRLLRARLERVEKRPQVLRASR